MSAAGPSSDVDAAWAAIADGFRLVTVADTGPAALADLRDKLVAAFTRHGFPDADQRVALPVDYVRFLQLAGGYRSGYDTTLFAPKSVVSDTVLACESFEQARPPDATLWMTVARWGDKHEIVLCCDRTDPRFGTVLDCYDDHPWWVGGARDPEFGDPDAEVDAPAFVDRHHVADSFTGYLESLPCSACRP